MRYWIGFVCTKLCEYKLYLCRFSHVPFSSFFPPPPIASNPFNLTSLIMRLLPGMPPPPTHPHGINPSTVHPSPPPHLLLMPTQKYFVYSTLYASYFLCYPFSCSVLPPSFSRNNPFLLTCPPAPWHALIDLAHLAYPTISFITCPTCPPLLGMPPCVIWIQG